MGTRAAALTLLGDLAKGVAAAAIGDLWVGEAAGFAAGFAAVVGHSFPIWHRFRGGKGVATGVGVLLWMEPLVGVAFGVAWAVFTFGFKIASLASLILVVAWVPALALVGVRGWALVWAAATALLIAIRHSSNIKRLIRGQERTSSDS
jgi:glycerol-3-phosphate acyltransferase PlsY